jgi:hypothetical protein
LNLIHSRFVAQIKGGTDTEHMAALYMTELLRNADEHDPETHSALAMWLALQSVIEQIESIQKKHGIKNKNIVNAIASMHVFYLFLYFC